MSVELTVKGPAEQKALAAKLRREAARFQRRISQASNRSVDRNFRPVLVGMAPQFLPSGYAPLVQKDVKTRTVLRGSRLTVTVFAPTGASGGRASGRDMRALERGSLRHPVFARSVQHRSKWTWVGQRVKPLMSETALKATRPLIVRDLEGELRDIARDVDRGV